MGRQKTKQVRIGRKENRLVRKLSKKIREYKLYKANKKGETYYNSQLLNWLKQDDLLKVNLSNTSIPPANFAGETFRPEFYLKNKLCAIECKRLTEKYAKSKWKEGLSQALLYAHTYKMVFLIFFDFTKESKYTTAFGRGNLKENSFAKKLKTENRISIISLKPSE